MSDNIITKRDGFEIVHHIDETNKITVSSFSNVFTVECGLTEYTITIPLSTLYKILKRSRLLRRLLRLDKSNAYPIVRSGKLVSLIIIFRSVVYHWSVEQGLKPVLTMTDCRNIMHGAITESDTGSVFFGEYNNNKNRSLPVSIYRTNDCGVSWESVYSFPAGATKHIHNIQWDVHSRSLWVSTGDNDGECHIIQTDENFSEMRHYGDGSQKYRTCHLFFTERFIVWGMDSPLESCHIIRMDRATGTIETIADISGPAWYGKNFKDKGYLLSTSVEPGVNCLDGKSKLYFSHDLEYWKECFCLEKDIYHPVYFKFGSIYFSSGSTESFYVGFDALKKYDGTMIHINLLEQDLEY